jgi:hypothetical protein
MIVKGELLDGLILVALKNRFLKLPVGVLTW